jgi:hypothetical protein
MSDAATYIEIYRPPLRWKIREDLKALAEEPLFTSFDEFIETHKPQVVTRTPGKTTVITPLELAGTKRDFIIKHYASHGLHMRLHAAEELKHGLEIERRGIPVSVPAATAERRKFGMAVECFVVTERPAGGVSLGDFLLHPETPPAAKEKIHRRRQVIRNFAALMKQLHDNGVHQHDCDLGNFLLDAELPALTLIDLAGIGISSSLPRGKRVENLAKLIRRRLRISATDLARLLSVYAGPGRANRNERHGLAAEISAANINLLKQQFAKEASECLREGQNFQSLACAECTGTLRKIDHATREGQSLASLLQAARGAIQTGGRRGAAFRFDAGNGEETIWAFEGRYTDLEFTWRERNGLYPAGAWKLAPLGLCRMKRTPERGMLFMIPSKEHKEAKPFLELTHAERRLLEEISQGVEGFEQE